MVEGVEGAHRTVPLDRAVTVTVQIPTVHARCLVLGHGPRCNLLLLAAGTDHDHIRPDPDLGLEPPRPAVLKVAEIDAEALAGTATTAEADRAEVRVVIEIGSGDEGKGIKHRSYAVTPQRPKGAVIIGGQDGQSN